MDKFTVNVAKRAGDNYFGEPRYMHHFRVENLEDEAFAREVANDLRKLYPDAKVEVTVWRTYGRKLEDV